MAKAVTASIVTVTIFWGVGDGSDNLCFSLLMFSSASFVQLRVTWIILKLIFDMCNLIWKIFFIYSITIGLSLTYISIYLNLCLSTSGSSVLFNCNEALYLFSIFTKYLLFVPLKLLKRVYKERAYIFYSLKGCGSKERFLTVSLVQFPR